MPGIFRFRQLRKSPRRHSRQVLSWPPCQPTPTRCPLVPRGNTSTHFIDDACDFMSWNAGILNSRPKPFFREHITVANTTSLYPNAHLSCVRFGNFALDNFEISAGFRNLRHHHWCCRWSDRYSERCHKSSYEFSAIVEKILTVTGEALRFVDIGLQGPEGFRACGTCCLLRCLGRLLPAYRFGQETL